MKYTILISCLLIVSCSERENTLLQNANPYFPLHVGNKWVYKLDEYSLSVQVPDLYRIGKHSFALVKEKSIAKGDTTPVTIVKAFRYDDQGNIERGIPDVESLRLNVGSSPKVPRDGVSVWYKLDAQVGESWFAFGNSEFTSKEIHEYKITLISRSDTVVTYDKTYVDCYKFYVDDQSESDTEYYDWLAKDIGLVKRAYGPDESKGFMLSTFETSL